jgi:hypothetical protein
MNTNIKSNTATMPPPVVCEYEIGGVKYIVSATTKAGARETATAKIRRLIMNEVANMM